MVKRLIELITLRCGCGIADAIVSGIAAAAAVGRTLAVVMAVGLGQCQLEAAD